jgi:hypothetical protein
MMPRNVKRYRRQIYREHQTSEQYLTMDFRNEASSWTIHHLAEDTVRFRLRYTGKEMTHLQSLHRLRQAAAQKVPGSGPRMHVGWNVCP